MTPSQTNEIKPPAGKFAPVVGVKQISYFDDRYYRLVLYDNSIVFLPSVTTVLRAVPKPYLATWRGNIGNQEADRVMAIAMDRGSRVHHACYVFATGGGVIYDPHESKGMADLNEAARSLRKQFTAAGREYVTVIDQEEMMMALRFQRWMDAVKPEVRGAELGLYSLELGVAGTLDYVHMIESGSYQIASKPIKLEKTGLYIQDLKTGSEDQSYWMQLAAYAKMYELSTGAHVEGALITYLDTQTQTGIQGTKTIYKHWEELQPELDDFMNVKRMWSRVFGSQSPKVFDFPNLLYHADDKSLDIPHGFIIPNVNDRVKDSLPNVAVKDAVQEKPEPPKDQPQQKADEGTAAESVKAPTKRGPKSKGADLTGLGL